MSAGKAYTLLTDHLITGLSLARKSGSSQTLHTLSLWLSLVVIFEALFGCHDILISGKRPMKWGQRPDMTIIVDWGVTYQFKQTNT